MIYINIEQLKPYPKNAKKHPKKQIEQVANSIKEFGFNQPIVVDKNNVVIVGHGRLEAAKLLKMKEVPTLQVDLTEEQAKAYRLADNKLNESDWEMDLVIGELKELSDEMFDLTGFDKDLIIEPDDKDDEVPDVPEEPTSKLGDIYQLGEHRLMCGDATKLGDVEKLMDGQKADMVFTDPPYGMFLDTNYKRDITNSSFSRAKGISRGGDIYDNVIGDYGDFSTELIETVFRNFGYVKEVFIWGCDYYAELLEDRNGGSWLVWDKRSNEDGSVLGSTVGSHFELCWSKQKHTREIIRVKWCFIFGVEKEFDRKRHHPTQKPIALAEWFLQKYSKREGKIVDLYGGSGSTLIAAEKLNRKCYMSELDPKYVDVIIKRYEDYTGNKAIKL